MMPRSLPIAIYDPVDATIGEWKCDLPDQFARNLQDLFFGQMTDSQRAKYLGSLKVQNDDVCILSSVIGRQKTIAKRNQPNAACRTCVKKGRLCGKLIKLDGEERIGVYPIAGGGERFEVLTYIAPK
jgi:hypothetical protein